MAEPGASVKISSGTEPAAPESSVQKSEVRTQKKEPAPKVSENSDRPPERAVAQPARKKKSQAEVEKSLLALVGPPSLLHTNSDADTAAPEAKLEPTAAAEARLTKEEVVDVADAGARTRGYTPAEYQRAEPRYNSKDQIWTIEYEQRLPDEPMESAKHFSFTVDDKTKGIVFVPAK
jgi:hypothetical protein